MITKVEIDIKTPWLLSFLLTLRSNCFWKLKSRKDKQKYISRCYRACHGKLTIRQIRWCMVNKIDILGL